MRYIYKFVLLIPFLGACVKDPSIEFCRIVEHLYLGTDKTYDHSLTDEALKNP